MQWYIYFLTNLKKNPFLGSTVCIDRHRLCNFWASINECESNKVWMLVQCAKSCKSCKGQQINERSPPTNGEFTERDCTFVASNEGLMNI